MTETLEAKNSLLLSFVKFTSGFSGYIVKVAAAWGIIAVVGNFLFEERLEPWQRIPERIEENRQTLEAYGQRMAEMEADIRDLIPPLKIAEYDDLLSFQVGDCYVGGSCRVRLRFRRTENGRFCEAPRAAPKIINHYGSKHSSRFTDGFQPIKGDTDWQIVEFAIHMPRSVQPGNVRYYSELTYLGCDPAKPGVPVNERSPFVAMRVQPAPG